MRDIWLGISIRLNCKDHRKFRRDIFLVRGERMGVNEWVVRRHQNLWIFFFYVIKKASADEYKLKSVKWDYFALSAWVHHIHRHLHKREQRGWKPRVGQAITKANGKEVTWWKTRTGVRTASSHEKTDRFSPEGFRKSKPSNTRIMAPRLILGFDD